MAAGFQYLLVADIHDTVTGLDRGQTMGDDEGGAPLKKRLNPLLQQPFGLGVD